MNIIVVGAGKIGSALAGYLSREGHDITVIDINPERVSYISTTLDVMINEGVLENCAKVGEYFRKRAHEVIEKNHPDAVDEIRGLGLINGIQLKKETGAPVVDLCFKDSKVLINNTNGNVLRFIPPLVTTEEEVDIVIKAVDDAMTKLGW